MQLARAANILSEACCVTHQNGAEDFEKIYFLVFYLIFRFPSQFVPVIVLCIVLWLLLCRSKYISFAQFHDYFAHHDLIYRNYGSFESVLHNYLTLELDTAKAVYSQTADVR